MKVNIGPYTNWVGPYQIAEILLFWKKKNEWGGVDDTVHKFGKWLAYDKNGKESWLNKICQWIESKKKRRIKVHIENRDCWNLDSTLAYIIAPALKKLKTIKHGGPHVDDEDVPKKLRSTTGKRSKKDIENGTDKNWFKRWDWVMDEMIFAFETVNTDWEEQFWKVHPELDMTEHPEDAGQLTVPMRWAVEGECDWAGRKKMEERIQNGFRLFGKYYQGLWD